MSLLLHIETATKVCSVALSLNGKLIHFIEETSEKYIHSERLTILIETLMFESSRNLADLNAITIDKGPGSFTGLRIGVSVAKGLCYALKKPLISVDSLVGLYYGFKNINNEVSQNELILPMIDARRMEVYTSGFKSNGEIIFPTSARVVNNSFFEQFNEFQKVHVFGDGAKKVMDSFVNNRLVFHSEILCSATHLIERSYEKYCKNTFENLAYFEPYYLKDFKPN